MFMLTNVEKMQIKRERKIHMINRIGLSLCRPTIYSVRNFKDLKVTSKKECVTCKMCLNLMKNGKKNQSS